MGGRCEDQARGWQRRPAAQISGRISTTLCTKADGIPKPDGRFSPPPPGGIPYQSAVSLTVPSHLSRSLWWVNHKPVLLSNDAREDWEIHACCSRAVPSHIHCRLSLPLDVAARGAVSFCKVKPDLAQHGCRSTSNAGKMLTLLRPFQVFLWLVVPYTACYEAKMFR